MEKNKLIFVLTAAAAAFGLVIYQYAAPDNFADEFLSRFEEAAEPEAAAVAQTIASLETVAESQGKAAPAKDAVRVPIVVYHSVAPYYPSESAQRKKFSVEPAVFEKQLQYFKENGYTVISFDNFLNHFSTGAALPEKPVILTFDDGWENQYRYAFPLLKKYNDAATFFIFTNAIGHMHFLTWPQIKELSAAGMTIGGHTKSHPYLYKITNKNELRDEILGGRDMLERGLGKTVDIFAYPFGHYTQELIALLKENGFRAARTDGYKGVMHSAQDLYTLTSIDGENDMAKFVAALSLVQ